MPALVAGIHVLSHQRAFAAKTWMAGINPATSLGGTADADRCLTHFFPKRFFDKFLEVAGNYKDMGKRVRAIPALFDLDARKKIVDGHKDYAQILSYPQPPLETFAKSPAQIDELIRIVNDGFAELCAKERDHFPGWVAQISLDAPDA